MSFDITPTGVWATNERERHTFDLPLAAGILDVIVKKKCTTAYDIGCGTGAYTKFLNEHGIHTKGFDGNPMLREWFGDGSILDFSVAHDLPSVDCVISLEVGEHLPPQYEETFLKNVFSPAKDLVVLSWAIPGTGGTGHFNPQPNEYILDRISKMNGGWMHLNLTSQKLRMMAENWWFKDTVFVFSRL